MAEQVAVEWEMVSRALAVEVDYHGFYDGALEPTVEQVLGDMLTEVAPRAFTDDEVRGRGLVSGSPVALCNAAWQTYQQDLSRYDAWEAEQRAALLKAQDSRTAEQERA